MEVPLAPSPVAVGDRTLRILIVEDNDDDRDLLTLYLRNNEFTCEYEFVDTPEGMQSALDRQRWDVVISDHRLPRFSSAAALEMVKALEPSPPFILVSGFIGETAAVEALHQGATDFVMKDNLARLGPAIRRALHNAGMRRAARATEMRFRSLTEIAPAGIFLAGADERCLWINEQGLSICGATRETATGVDWRELFQVELSRPPGPPSPTPLAFEARLVHGDASVTWISGEIMPQWGETGELEGHVGVVNDITQRKRTELELIGSEQRLRELSSHILRLEEQMRADLAREIHDDIGAQLTSIKIDLSLVRAGVLNQPDMIARLGDCDQLVDAVVASSRRIIKTLRPAVLDHGIVAALQWQLQDFERRTGVQCHFDTGGDEPTLNEHQSVALFRIVQEALSNIAKHARASEVHVTLFARTPQLTLEIADNGVGLPAGRAERPGSYGVIGMRERVQALDGWLEIAGQPGQGVTLMLALPYAQPEAA